MKISLDMKKVVSFAQKHDYVFNIFNYKHGGDTYELKKGKYYHNVFIDKDDKNRKYYTDLFLDFSINNKDRRFLQVMGYDKYCRNISRNILLFYIKKNKLDIVAEDYLPTMEKYMRDKQVYCLIVNMF